MTNRIETSPPFLSQDNKHAFRNPWVIGWLAFVGLVLVVNTIFIVVAMKTNPGLVDADYYEKGRNYEKHIQDRIIAKNTLGWQIQLNSTMTDVTMGASMDYHLNVVDKAGLPLEASQVTLRAYRASDASADFSHSMEKVETGLYRSRMTFPLKGYWELIATVEQNQDVVSIKQKINVKAP